MSSSIFISFLLVFVAVSLIDIAHVQPAKFRTNSLPDFVLKYAPISYLFSKEQYWPSDVSAHLQKVVPEVSFAAVGGPPTLQTLPTFGNNVYLTAVDDALAHKTPFFTSVVGKPVDGLSAAPATIIVVEKPGGITDAFYFYFYSFNFGNA